MLSPGAKYNTISVANQDSSPKENEDLKAALMTMNQEQECQAALPGDPANEQLPRNSAIFPLQNLGVLAT
ncbi:hypothetical protein DSO57_1036434 [Entomophthora muscae]|uniref:Uncharacterized protein n=1 Tax=Entomophthora muscae TaxID=34485 RepID=A0ACC2RQ78_9FUNG|nr:hypothetical protein DSO57_1036434 [Entomophthora muscae]